MEPRRKVGTRDLALAAGFVVVYVGLALVGRELGVLDTLPVSYPPAGLAFVAGWIFGLRALVPAFVGELVSGILVFQIGSIFSPAQMGIDALGYAGVYVLVAVAFRRISPRPDDAGALPNRMPLLLVGIVVAAPLAAAFGVAMQRWAGPEVGPSTAAAFGVLMVGDAIGVATVGTGAFVGHLMLESRRRGGPLLPMPLRRDPPATAATLLLSPALLAATIFELRPQGIAFLAAVFVPMTLISLRYGGAGATIAAFVASPLITVVANRHSGEVVLARTDLQVLLLSAVVCSLVVGAVVDERERAARHDRERGDIVSGMTDLVAIVGRDGRLRYLNPAGRRLLGLSEDAPVRHLAEEGFAADPAGAADAARARDEAAAAGIWAGDVVLRGVDGREVVGEKRVLTHRSHEGEVVRWTTLVHDVTEERRLQRELDRAAVEDPLTGLSNRHHMVVAAGRAVEACRAGRDPVPMILVKVDRIAMLMGALGIELADEMLREVARRLVDVAGPGCTVARLEGVTFGLLPDDASGVAGGRALGERVVDAISVPFSVGGRQVPITCSVGLATLDASCTAGEGIRAADVAAQRAQDAGGGRLVVHERTMTEGASDRLELEAALDGAVRRRAWRLDYQPIADIATSEVRAVEALLRFEDDLPTYPLVVLAEANGLIVPLGRDVLEDACRRLVSWGAAGAHLGVHVNVSGRQLTEPGFVEDVQAVLRSTGIDPDRLTLELTETAVLDDLTVGAEIMGRIAELGVHAALDDFGIGASSLRVLASLPFDTVKLDRFLTMDVATSAQARALVGATVEFARALDLQVVAEGVEEADQRQVLLELGCDLLQGFLLSKAVGADEVLQRWAREPTAADQPL